MAMPRAPVVLPPEPIYVDLHAELDYGDGMMCRVPARTTNFNGELQIHFGCPHSGIVRGVRIVKDSEYPAALEYHRGFAALSTDQATIQLSFDGDMRPYDRDRAIEVMNNALTTPTLNRLGLGLLNNPDYGSLGVIS